MVIFKRGGSLVWGSFKWSSLRGVDLWCGNHSKGLQEGWIFGESFKKSSSRGVDLWCGGHLNGHLQERWIFGEGVIQKDIFKRGASMV